MLRLHRPRPSQFAQDYKRSRRGKTGAPATQGPAARPGQSRCQQGRRPRPARQRQRLLVENQFCKGKARLTRAFSFSNAPRSCAAGVRGYLL